MNEERLNQVLAQLKLSAKELTDSIANIEELKEQKTFAVDNYNIRCEAASIFK